MLHIVQRAVKEECNLRNDAKLLCNLAAELSAESPAVFVQCAHHGFGLVGVLRHVHDLARLGVLLVEVDDALGKLDFLLLNGGVGVLGPAEALEEILDDDDRIEALLAKVKPNYGTDAMDAARIAAISQYVMENADVSWWEFWRDDRDDARRVWAKAVLAAASRSSDDYVICFYLDQLRWCGYPAGLR